MLCLVSSKRAAVHYDQISVFIKALTLADRHKLLLSNIDRISWSSEFYHSELERVEGTIKLNLALHARGRSSPLCHHCDTAPISQC